MHFPSTFLFIFDIRYFLLFRLAPMGPEGAGRGLWEADALFTIFTIHVTMLLGKSPFHRIVEDA
jgi:hypothetical protein